MVGLEKFRWRDTALLPVAGAGIAAGCCSFCSCRPRVGFRLAALSGDDAIRPRWRHPNSISVMTNERTDREIAAALAADDVDLAN